ncbi:hypothetical protein Goshw_016881, partial [Gossypium schwendimanii]|nr:hypothetical protein [Gossypium schwendimanii]
EFCGKEEPTRSNSSVGRATKKVRRRTDPSPDMDDTIVDKNGQKIQDVGVDKMSYKSMLMGTSLDVSSQEKMEEFVLHDGDVVTKLVIILWSLRHSIRFMDLENDYFLVWFQDEGYFSKVLVGGTWVIFGQYLTIRHWSLDFSTSNNEVDIQVVWIRIPGLPESYYSNFLLRAIGQKPLVPKVKINAHIQRIEYESLSVVCFKCELYGNNSYLCQGRRNKASERGVNGEELAFSVLAADLGITSLVIKATDRGYQPGQIKRRDLGKNFNAKWAKYGPNALRPVNVNIGLTAIKGGNVLD